MAGTVKSTKMKNTIIVRRNYFHFIKKYQRCGTSLLLCRMRDYSMSRLSTWCKAYLVSFIDGKCS